MCVFLYLYFVNHEHVLIRYDCINIYDTDTLYITYHLCHTSSKCYFETTGIGRRDPFKQSSDWGWYLACSDVCYFLSGHGEDLYQIAVDFGFYHLVLLIVDAWQWIGQLSHQSQVSPAIGRLLICKYQHTRPWNLTWIPNSCHILQEIAFPDPYFWYKY